MVKPIHLQDYVHLRPNSAAHFEQQPYQFEPIDWTDGELTLNSVIFLSPKDDQLSQNEKSFELTFINKVNAYELLLKQAFALTTKLAAHNQKMIDDYLALAHQVKAYRLRYKVGFEHLNEIFDGIASEIF